MPGHGGPAGRCPGCAHAAAAAAAAADGYTAASTRRIPGQMEKDEASLFDGIDTSLAGVAQFAGANPPEALTAGLAAVVDQAQRAQQAFDSGNDAGTAAPIEAGPDGAARAARAARLDGA